MTEHRLAQLTRLEAGERARAGAVCLVPAGSLEQHGEHLPLFTDSLLAEHVCLEAARQARCDALVTPPLWTGLSPHHLRFGATVTVRSETFAALVRETVASLRSWCSRVIVVNGHGGNRGPMITLGVEDAVESVSYWELLSATRISELFPFDMGSVGHAGEFETSVMLAAFPGLVGEPGLDYEPIEEENAAFLLPAMGASGVLGDPRAATSEAGREVLDEVIGRLVMLLDGQDDGDDQGEEAGFADESIEEDE